jgi:RHS repeat-associated protein
MRREIRISLQIVAVIAVVLMLAPSLGQATPPSTGSIDGYVKNASTLAPIVGARVDVLTTTKYDMTDATGYYKITSVSTGTYSVKASATGYTDLTVPGVVVAKGVTTRQNFNLVPKPASGYVDGYVFDSVTLSAISGAHATLVGTSFAADTNAIGLFNITADPGTYTIKVTKSGYSDYTYSSQVTVVSSQLKHAGDAYLVKAVLKLPIPIERASAVWTGSLALIFAGIGPLGPLTQVVKYNPATDTPTTVTNIFGSARFDTSAIWSSQYSSAYVFGGQTSTGAALREVIKYNPVDDSKTVISTGLPTAVYGTSAVWSGSYGYIFGGRYLKNGQVTYVQDIVRWDPATSTSTKLTAKLPSARAFTSAAYDGRYAYVFGGMISGGNSINEIVRFDPTNNQVSLLSTRLPYGLMESAAVRDGGNILLFGGTSNGLSAYDTVLEFNISTQAVNVKTQKLPTTLCWESAVNDGYTNWLFGGSTQPTTVAIDTITRYHNYIAVPNFGVEPYDVFVGGMVNAAGGNLVISAEDMTVQGRGFKIAIGRTYNSQLADKLGPMGYGWTFNYNTNVKEQTYGDVLLTQACGSQHLFVKKSDGTYVCPPGLTDKLTKDYSSGVYTLWSLDGSKTVFSSQGKLAYQMDKNSNKLNFVHDQAGKLIRVADDSGQYIKIVYNSDGLILKTFDQMGQSYYYNYTTALNGDKCLSEVGQQNITSPLVHMTYLQNSRRMDTIRYFVVNKYVARYDDIVLVDDCTNFSYDASGRVTQVWKFESAEFDFPQPIYPAVMQYKIDFTNRTSTKATCSLDKIMTVTMNVDGLPIKISGAPIAANVGSGGGCTGSSLFPGKEGNENLTLTWNKQFQIETSTDGNSNTYRIDYNSYGQPIKVTDPYLKFTSYEIKVVDTSSQYIALLMNVTDALGNKTQYVYDERGNNVKVIDALGDYTQSWYDAYGLVNKTADRKGYATTYTYDSDGSWGAIKSGSGGYTSWMTAKYATTRSYSPTQSIQTSFTSGPMSYDTGSSIMWKEFTAKPVQQISVKMYCAAYYHNNDTRGDIMDAGIRMRLFDSNGVNYANYTYWLACWYKNTNDRTVPDSNTIKIWNKPTMYQWVTLDRNPSTDWPGIDWNKMAKVRVDLYFYAGWSYGDYLTLFFDDLSVDDAPTHGEFVTDHFDSHGYLTGVTSPLGATTQYGYDSLGQTVDTTTPTGEKTTYEYSYGQLVNTTYPNGAYDRVDRSFQGEPMRRIISGVATTYDINVTLRTYNSVTDALDHTTRYYYNSMGFLTKVVDANGHAYAFTYELGRAKAVALPMGEVATVWYDHAGNVVQRKDPSGNITQYSYDKLNRLYQTLYPNGDKVISTYDALGRLVNMTGPSGWEKTAYDALGRAVNVWTHYNFIPGKIGGAAYDVTESLTYDKNGNVVSDKFKDAHITFWNNYTYDAVNRLSRMSTSQGLSWSFFYDKDGRRSSMLAPTTIPGGPVYNTTYVYDSMGNVLYINVSSQGGGYLPGSYSYESDQLGRVTKATDFTGTTTYAYDAIGQLTSYAHNGTWTNLTYDPVGNRITESVGPTVTTYSYNANDELTSASDGSSYKYDGNGNAVSVTSQGMTSYFTYDYENRMISAAVPGPAYYNYSGDGRLMSYSSLGFGCIAFVYSHMPGLATVVMRADRSGGTDCLYWNVPGTDEPLGFAYYYWAHGSLSPYFTFVDGLANTRYAVAADNSMGWYAQSYSPFGEMANDPAAYNYIWCDLPSFQGRRFDPYANTYDFRARYYDQATGRFDQRDPLPSYGASAYVFVFNNPLTGRDPSGEYGDTKIGLPCWKGGWWPIGTLYWSMDKFINKLATSLVLNPVAVIGCAIGAVYYCGYLLWSALVSAFLGQMYIAWPLLTTWGWCALSYCAANFLAYLALAALQAFKCK